MGTERTTIGPAAGVIHTAITSLMTEASEGCQDSGEAPGPKERNIKTTEKSGWFMSDAVDNFPDAKSPLDKEAAVVWSAGEHEGKSMKGTVNVAPRADSW